MTHNYHHHIDRIVKANKVYRFEAELEETEDDERSETLKKLIELHNAHKDEKQIKDDKMKAHLKVLKDSQYQKKWQFLNPEQRLNRMNEFIERKEINDDKIIKPLTEAVMTGTLKTKDVEYDKIKCQIDHLTVLVIDEETKRYHLNQAFIGKSNEDQKQVPDPDDSKKSKVCESSKQNKDEKSIKKTKSMKSEKNVEKVKKVSVAKISKPMTKEKKGTNSPN
jgi:hypothetical protein